MGATPQSRAQAGSERTRSGLSPATMSISAAVSAPTGLAVRTAEAAGLVLAGFVRGDRAVAYSHASRLLTPAPGPVSSS